MKGAKISVGSLAKRGWRMDGWGFPPGRVSKVYVLEEESWGTGGTQTRQLSVWDLVVARREGIGYRRKNRL